MIELMMMAVALILPALLGVALAKHSRSAMDQHDLFYDPYWIAAGFALVICAGLFGALSEEAAKSLGHWVRYIGGLSAIIALVGFAVGRFVVKGED